MKRFIPFYFFLIPVLAFSQVTWLDGVCHSKVLSLEASKMAQGKKRPDIFTHPYEYILLNGDSLDLSKDSGTVDIDLQAHNIKDGDSVHVKIFSPIVSVSIINYKDLAATGQFEISKVFMDPDGTMHFTALNESGKFTYTIEAFRWNKWMTIGEVKSVGSVKPTDYSINIRSWAYPEMLVRVIAFKYQEIPVYSKPIKVPDFPPVNLVNPHPKKAVEFSGETRYELYDEFGNLVLMGYGRKVDIRKLQRGVYYLNYDNKTAKIIF